MKSRRTKTTEGGQDGSYTIYLTIGHLKKEPSSLTIKYDDMKRVAYYLSTDEEATAMTLTSDRKIIMYYPIKEISMLVNFMVICMHKRALSSMRFLMQ